MKPAYHTKFNFPEPAAAEILNPMSSIDELFDRLKQNDQKAFMPFVTAGDPHLDFTEELLVALDKAGCQLAEVGIPYSDPIADGPVIQASYTRALERDLRLDDIFAMLQRTTAKIKMPVVTMVSYAIIYRTGIDEFLCSAMAAGVAGAIVPDLPVDESAVLAAKCCELDFSLIQLITPTTENQRAIEILEQATGFIYYVSVTGITGERTELPDDLTEKTSWLRQQTQLPICIGFGISQPEHVQLLKPVSDGVIVGSAIVRRIAKATTDSIPKPEVIDDVVQFVTEMMEQIKQ